MSFMDQITKALQSDEISEIVSSVKAINADPLLLNDEDRLDIGFEAKSLNTLGVLLKSNSLSQKRRAPLMVRRNAKCLWQRAIMLSYPEEHSLSTPLEFDMCFLKNLIFLIECGLKIDYTDHYRTSFMYEAYIMLYGTTKMHEEVESLMMEIYDHYIRQSGCFEVRVYGHLKDICNQEKHSQWVRQKIMTSLSPPSNQQIKHNKHKKM